MVSGFEKLITAVFVKKNLVNILGMTKVFFSLFN